MADIHPAHPDGVPPISNSEAEMKPTFTCSRCGSIMHPNFKADHVRRCDGVQGQKPSPMGDDGNDEWAQKMFGPTPAVEPGGLPACDGTCLNCPRCKVGVFAPAVETERNEDAVTPNMPGDEPEQPANIHQGYGKLIKRRVEPEQGTTAICSHGWPTHKCPMGCETTHLAGNPEAWRGRSYRQGRDDERARIYEDVRQILSANAPHDDCMVTVDATLVLAAIRGGDDA